MGRGRRGLGRSWAGGAHWQIESTTLAAVWLTQRNDVRRGDRRAERRQREVPPPGPTNRTKAYNDWGRDLLDAVSYRISY